ncbi:hypothetical protein DPSP01_006859 [Paraphaeosphaeria sporulosa]
MEMGLNEHQMSILWSTVMILLVQAMPVANEFLSSNEGVFVQSRGFGSITRPASSRQYAESPQLHHHTRSTRTIRVRVPIPSSSAQNGLISSTNISAAFSGTASTPARCLQ